LYAAPITIFLRKGLVGFRGKIYQENMTRHKREGRQKMEIKCRRACGECPISSCSLHPSFHLFIQTYLRDMAEVHRRR
jgi:hypothetical protein